MIEFRSAAHDKKTVDNINHALKLQELVKERINHITGEFDGTFKAILQSLVEESERKTVGGNSPP